MSNEPETVLYEGDEWPVDGLLTLAMGWHTINAERHEALHDAALILQRERNALKRQRTEYRRDLREALDALEGLYARLNRPDDATDARAILTKHGRAV